MVIPEEIPNWLNLHVGSQFIVMTENDVVILKLLSRPNFDEFDALMTKAKVESDLNDFYPSDIEVAIKGCLAEMRKFTK